MEKQRAGEEERERHIETEREVKRENKQDGTHSAYIWDISKHSVNKDYNYKPHKSPSI